MSLNDNNESGVSYINDLNEPNSHNINIDDNINDDDDDDDDDRNNKKFSESEKEWLEMLDSNNESIPPEVKNKLLQTCNLEKQLDNTVNSYNRFISTLELDTAINSAGKTAVGALFGTVLCPIVGTAIGGILGYRSNREEREQTQIEVYKLRKKQEEKINEIKQNRAEMARIKLPEITNMEETLYTMQKSFINKIHERENMKFCVDNPKLQSEILQFRNLLNCYIMFRHKFGLFALHHLLYTEWANFNDARTDDYIIRKRKEILLDEVANWGVLKELNDISADKQYSLRALYTLQNPFILAQMYKADTDKAGIDFSIKSIVDSKGKVYPLPDNLTNFLNKNAFYTKARAIAFPKPFIFPVKNIFLISALIILLILCACYLEIQYLGEASPYFIISTLLISISCTVEFIDRFCIQRMSNNISQTINYFEHIEEITQKEPFNI